MCVTNVHPMGRNLKVLSTVIEAVPIPMMNHQIGIWLHQKTMHRSDLAGAGAYSLASQAGVGICGAPKFPAMPIELCQQLIVSIVRQDSVAVAGIYSHGTNPDLAVSACVNFCVNFFAVLCSFAPELARSDEAKIVMPLICLVFRFKACIAYSPI